MNRHLLFFLSAIFCGLQARANFDFNPACVKAYREIMHLRLDDARVMIDAERKRNPGNSITVLLDNYIDYFTVLTSETTADFERLKSNKSARLGRLEKENRNSPYFLYAQAEINLQSALVHVLFKEYFNSSLEINRAYKFLQENDAKYPGFPPDQKCLGLVNAALGSIPEGLLKKALGAFGIRGNSRSGVKMLENLVSTLPKSAYSYYYDEVVFCLANVQLDILSDFSAYPQILVNVRRIDEQSLLRTYLLTYSALRTAHNDDALAALPGRPIGKEYVYFPRLDYMTGISRMYKLDPSAGRILSQFVQDYKGVNGTKDAYLNLAWLSLIRGDSSGYRANAGLVKTRGYTYFYKDQQAVIEVGYPAPDTDLLRARLLCDGGYYAGALAALNEKKAEDLKLLRDKIEYSYRLGRIYDELSKDDTALKFYAIAVNAGRKERFVFAANAAMRMAAIYENRKDFANARTWYKTAIDMKNHEAEKSIESKAREALKRVGG